MLIDLIFYECILCSSKSYCWLKMFQPYRHVTFLGHVICFSYYSQFFSSLYSCVFPNEVRWIHIGMYDPAAFTSWFHDLPNLNDYLTNINTHVLLARWRFIISVDLVLSNQMSCALSEKFIKKLKQCICSVNIYRKPQSPCIKFILIWQIWRTTECDHIWFCWSLNIWVHILSDYVLSSTLVLAPILLFDICYVDMADHIIMDRYILSN